MKKEARESISDRALWRRAILHLSSSDSRLKPIVGNVKGFGIKLERNHYGSLVKAIVYQQISGRAGDSIFKKFLSLYGGSMPTPKDFLKTGTAKVRGAGISPQKYSYIKDLSERIERGELELKRFRDMDDEDIIGELDAVKGIGRWTSEMFLIFTLGRTDVLPVDDLGLRKAVKKAYGLRELPGRERFEAIAKPWHPYCSVATVCLWRSIGS
jgi:DNA-3-methyladenine glycosylase II